MTKLNSILKRYFQAVRREIAEAEARNQARGRRHRPTSDMLNVNPETGLRIGAAGVDALGYPRGFGDS